MVLRGFITGEKFCWVLLKFVLFSCREYFLLPEYLVCRKKIIRIMAKVKTRTSCRPIFPRMKILTFPCIYILHILLYVKKNKAKFRLLSEGHSYATRGRTVLTYPIHRTSKYEYSPSYTGVELYNKLPDSIKGVESLKVFKRQLVEYLLTRCFYSIDEYMQQ